MRKFFAMDGKFWRVLTKVADIVWLNILTVLCCIPVITAGAALTALYSLTMKMVRDEEGYVTRSFFKAFGQNFLKSTVMWLIILAGTAVILADVFIIGNYAMEFFYYLLIPMCAITLVLLGLFLYVFQLQAYFENTIRGTMKNALKLAVAHLPYTLLFLILQALPIVVIILAIEGYTGLVMLLVGCSGIAYICSYAYRGIFEKYEEAPAQEEKAPEE